MLIFIDNNLVGSSPIFFEHFASRVKRWPQLCSSVEGPRYIYRLAAGGQVFTLESMTTLSLVLCAAIHVATASVDVGVDAASREHLFQHTADRAGSCSPQQPWSGPQSGVVSEPPRIRETDSLEWLGGAGAGGWGLWIGGVVMYMILSVLYQIYLSICRSNSILAMSPNDVAAFLRDHEPKVHKRAASTRALLREASSKLQEAGTLDGAALFVLSREHACKELGLTALEFEAVMDAKVEAVQLMPVGPAVLLPGLAVATQLRALAGRLFLTTLRAYLDGPMTRYNRWWKEQRNHLAQDSLPILQDVTLTRGIRCNEASTQTIDMLLPSRGVDSKAVPVLYAHGGGFVCCSSEILTHSLTPIVRAGLALFSIEYPLAPENPFPAAILSTLEAMVYVKRKTGCESIQLLGDSAGGNLVTYTAALLSDRPTLVKFSEVSGVAVHEWNFPGVTRVCSVYGFLDCESWRESKAAALLNQCWQCYMGDSSSNLPRCLLEMDKESLGNYPETLLIVGQSDPLLESTRVAERHLCSAGVDVKLFEYPGVHGFLGIPTQWSFGWWKLNSAPAMEKMVGFFSGRSVEYTREDQELDLSIWCVVLSHVLLILTVVGLVIGLTYQLV